MSSEVADESESTIIALEVFNKGKNESGEPVQAKLSCSKSLAAPGKFATIVLLMLFSFSTLVTLLKSIYEAKLTRDFIEPEDLMPSFSHLNYSVINDTIKVFEL